MLEQGKSVLQKQAQVTLQTLSAQLTGSGTTPPSAASPSQQQPAQDASASDFVKEIYATSSDQKPKTHQPVQQSQTLGAQVIDQLKGPASQDAERIAQLRKELRDQHTTSYYNPLVTRPKQEERVAEKVEREENE